MKARVPACLHQLTMSTVRGRLEPDSGRSIVASAPRQTFQASSGCPTRLSLTDNEVNYKRHLFLCYELCMASTRTCGVRRSLTLVRQRPGGGSGHAEGRC